LIARRVGSTPTQSPVRITDAALGSQPSVIAMSAKRPNEIREIGAVH
jgi:hypothetical protein